MLDYGVKMDAIYTIRFSREQWLINFPFPSNVMFNYRWIYLVTDDTKSTCRNIFYF